MGLPLQGQHTIRVALEKKIVEADEDGKLMIGDKDRVRFRSNVFVFSNTVENFAERVSLLMLTISKCRNARGDQHATWSS